MLASASRSGTRVTLREGEEARITQELGGSYTVVVNGNMFRIDGSGRSMARILAYPEDLLWPGAELSVTTPLGIALLGLRVGDRMPFRTGSDGPVCEVVVDDVRFRPRPRQAEPILNPSDRTGGGDDGSSDCAGRRPDGDLAAGDPVSAILCGRH